ANELYVGTTRSLTSPGGLYKATAAGCSSPSGSCTTCTWTWSRLLDEPSVTGIAVSPLNPSILYAASAQENAVVPIQEAGIWKSVDGGTNWSHLDHNGLGSLKTPILDYSADGGTLTIWAATEGSGVFKGTIMVPATPAGLTAVAVAGRKITISWQDLSKAEVGWSIERKKGANGNWSEVFHQNGPNVTSYTSMNLTAGSTYYFRVRAYDEAGNSGYSNEASATAF
ncbi:MAG TPA: fibronectin type III domain-containing protein, partial [Candidatus Polarisedimenticolia bacterium]|nr:fibronectin type III domain-containing protein [Candidatus Polarisedimenticolia bacterium]